MHDNHIFHFFIFFIFFIFSFFHFCLARVLKVFLKLTIWVRSIHHVSSKLALHSLLESSAAGLSLMNLRRYQATVLDVQHTEYTVSTVFTVETAGL